jgi:iron complex outermembrane recepter protein
MRKITLTLAGVSMLAIASPALAGNEAADEQLNTNAEVEAAQQADIVVVGATRRGGVDVQDVPLVVNTVTNDQIEKLNLRDFRDIQTVVPGLQMSSNSNGIGTTSSVRGVNFDVNASGNSGTIEYYLNDAPMTSGPLFQAMYDVGQIEVLRGPQGTVRGRAAPSGAITITNRRPDLNEVGGYMQGTANDLGGMNVQGAIGVPIIQDVFGIRVSGLQDFNRGDQVRSINSPIKPRNQAASGRVVAALNINDVFDASASYQYTDVKVRSFRQAASYNLFDSTGAAAAVAIDPSDRLSIDEVPGTVHSRFEVMTWKAGLNLAGQRLEYVGGDISQKIDVYTSSDEANYFVGRDFGQTTKTRPSQSSHEIRLQNVDKVAGMFDYSVGYFEQSLNSPTSLTSPTAIGGGGFLSTVVLTPVQRLGASKEESFFGNVTVHLGESTEISGGARHIKYHATGQLLINGVVNPAANQDSTYKTTVFSLGAKHRFSDDFMVYASFGSSWRPGISVVGNFSLTPSALERSFMVLEPEESKSYELGFKSTFMDKRVTFNVTAFKQDYTNYPYRSATGINYIDQPAPNFSRVSTFNFVAAVPVKVYGFEAELGFRPSDNLSFSANLAYANGKIKNGLVPCNDLNGDGVPDTSGAAPTLAQLQATVGNDHLASCVVNFRSASAPPISGNFQGEFTQSLTGGTDFYVRGLLSWFGNSKNDPANRFDDYDSYMLANVFAGVRAPDGQWEVSFFAKNLFNDETVTGVGAGRLRTNYRGAQPAVFEANYIRIGGDAGRGMVAPREFGISVRLSFGSR